MHLFFLIPLLFGSILFADESKEPNTPPSYKNVESTQEEPLSTDDYKILLKKTAFTLVGLIVVVFVSIWLLKRFSNTRHLSMNQMKYIKVIEKRSISPKSSLYLVQLGKEKILIAESQLEVRTIGKMDESLMHIEGNNKKL